MLSALSRGYSSWNGELDIYGEAIGKTASSLPEVGPGEFERHKHGVTVTPRGTTTTTAATTTTTARNPQPPPSSHFTAPPPPHHHYHHHQPPPPFAQPVREDGCLDLPKTFLTRKGALLLFTAPDAPPEKDRGVALTRRPAVTRKRKQQELIDLSLKLGTLERLSMSVLQYGDQNFDRENSSVSDKENRWFLKFLHQLQPPEPVPEEAEDPLADVRAQPGADLNVYLNDLKQRASSRCYGRESSLSSRARSQELRDILQQLEDAWPSGHGQPLSHAPTSTSFTDGSHLGAPDEFLYPRSPSLCSEPARSFSGRAKVLSSHKLTASLKSLNYLGRPPSTDPGESARSGVTSPDPVLSHSQLSHVRRTKSGYWSGTADLGSEPGRRPGSSQHYGLWRRSSADRHQAATPDSMSLDGGAAAQAGDRDLGSQSICVQLSSPMGFVLDGSERAPMGSVVEEETEVDRTSMSSSLQQEDDILLPSDGEEVETEGERRDWPSNQGQDQGQGLVKPLLPQYSGVLQDSGVAGENHDDDKLLKAEQGSGSRPGSRSGSVASLRSRDVYRPSSVMSSRAASRAGTVREEEEVDQEGLDELMAQGSEGEVGQLQVDEFLLDHAARQLERQEKFAAASSYTGSVDRPEADPETLVSLQGGGAATVSSSSVRSGSDTHGEALQQRMSAAPTPEPRLSTGTPEPRVAGTPEPRVAGTPEPRVTGTPEPRAAAGTPVLRGAAGTPEPPRVVAGGTPEPKVSATPPDARSSVSTSPASVVVDATAAAPASGAATPAPPEPKAPSQQVAVVTAEAEKPALPEAKPAAAVEAAPSVDATSGGKTEAEEAVSVEGDGADDAAAVAVAEAEYGVTPSSPVLPPPPPPPTSSRSESPLAAPSSASVAPSPVPEKSVSQPDKVPAPPAVLAEVKKQQPDKVPETAATKTGGTQSSSPVASKKPAPSSVHRPPKEKGGKSEKKGAGGKTFVKAMDITSVKTDHTDTDSAAPSSPKVKESGKKQQKETYRPPPPPPRAKTPAEKQGLVIPEHMKEAMERSNSLVAQNELENELMEMHKAMEESLGLPTRVSEEGEGLTEEELQQAEQALKERMEEAQRKMQEALLPEAQRSKSPSAATPRRQAPEAKPKKGKKVRVEDPKAAEEKAKKEAAKEQRRLERQKRLEEAQALQDLINQKEQTRKEKEEEAARKARDLEEQVEQMRAEEDAIQQAEEDAREQMATLRKAQREEREARRKADLEKKKQEALAKREKERRMMEEARKKEQEMLERIADSEMRRAIREEEERKRDEEERLAQERYEEELREAQQQAEEEERRLQELERQAEEEAFQRIIAEREEAERQRQELEYQARKMAEEEERQRQLMLAEENRLEEERQRYEAEEQKRKDEEKQRLKELQRLEEEAREKMRAEIERRREWALKRREVNLDRRKNLDGLRQTQGVTEPWTFTYFIQWARETYSRPMGVSADDKKKKRPVKKKK
ncbi:uncharacterized protein LOC143283170 isoform X2 [Babylonia areolata]|uniref:uncharacterized protein LOC143283170 isoform X2 n=1 Tax=Babylonia areolata TaxID=304850 RepID=UPI003FD2C870